MVLVTVHLHASGDFQNFPIDTDIQVTFATHRLEEFTVMTLTAADKRSEDEDLTSGIIVQDHVEHLLLCVFHHLLTGGIAVGLAGTGEEQTHVVVDLCRGAYCGSRIPVGGLLLDADDGRESCDLIHIRALHTAEEIAGIGRKGLDITALTLSKDGVEC